MTMLIKPDNLSDNRVVTLLQEHIDDMFRTSPPESVHTLDLTALQKTDISFWVIWQQNEPAGCVALKDYNGKWAEIKSMRTSNAFRGKGVGKLLLEHILKVAEQRNYQCLRLETGSQDFFEPARRIYQRYGFAVRGPFEGYTEDPNSVFMEKQLVSEVNRDFF